MADISISPRQGKLSVKIEVKSLQVVGYSGQLIGPDQKLAAEFDGSLGATTDFSINSLGVSPDKCIGGFINVIVEIADPLGADQDYNIVISTLQEDVLLQPVISLTGKTTSESVTRFPQFHINAIQ